MTNMELTEEENTGDKWKETGKTEMEHDACIPPNCVKTCKTGNDHQQVIPEIDSSGHMSVKPRSTKHMMLDRVANTDAHFKHQQRGDPDLTVEEKRNIAEEILSINPGTFLSRFGKYLMPDDLVYFDCMRDDYTVSFYLQEIEKRFADSVNPVKIRNRRYEAMKRLVDAGEYFSDHEMKARDPLLYEQMIGQYLTDDEVQSQVEGLDLGISSVLFRHIEAIHNNELYAKQVEQEESQLEEGDSDEENENEEQEMEEDEDDQDMGKKAESIPDEERQLLRHEFTAIMQQRFIHGQDTDFNYQDVDENVEYDSLDIRAQDEEEKYFDDEDPESVCSLASSIEDGMEDCTGFKQMKICDNRDVPAHCAGSGVTEHCTGSDVTEHCAGSDNDEDMDNSCEMEHTEESGEKTMCEDGSGEKTKCDKRTVDQTTCLRDSIDNEAVHRAGDPELPVESQSGELTLLPEQTNKIIEPT